MASSIEPAGDNGKAEQPHQPQKETCMHHISQHRKQYYRAHNDIIDESKNQNVLNSSCTMSYKKNHLALTNKLFLGNVFRTN